MTIGNGKSARLRRVQWVAVSFLTVAGIINYVDRSTLSIANTAIREEMGLSPGEMGLLLSAFSLAYAFAQLPTGALLDKLGSRIMLGAGMFAWSVAQVFCGMVNNFSQFIVARAVLGIGEAPQFPAGAKVVSEWFNLKERGRPTGMIVASSCIGPCIAPPLLTAMMLAFGWRWMFVITGILGAIVAIGWYMIYRNRSEVSLSPQEESFIDNGSERQSSESMTASEWKSLFTHRTTWGIIFGFMGVIYMVWLYLTWLPSYLEHARGFTVEKTGWVVAIPYLFGTAGMLSAGQVVDMLVKRGLSVISSRKWPICTGLLGGALFTIPAAYTPNATMAVVYICAAMFFINLASAASWTMISVVVPKRQVGSLGSIMNFGGYFAGSFAPVVTGFMVERTDSYVNALLAAAIISAIAALAFSLLVKNDMKDQQTSRVFT
jgi:MFS family permease